MIEELVRLQDSTSWRGTCRKTIASLRLIACADTGENRARIEVLFGVETLGNPLSIVLNEGSNIPTD